VTTAQYIPAAMCSDIGIVEQWFSHAPGRCAVEEA
jgi:hypothetical protein